jgi:outer membrane lipoprotein-sorting protein
MSARMNLPLALGALATCAFGLGTRGVAEEGSALDLVKQVHAAAPKVAFTAKAKLSSDRGWVRELAFSHKRLDGVTASYLEVTAPMDLKDTRFLLLDRDEGRDEQFIYVPKVKRSIQVGEQTRKQPFLGSEFYVGDLVQPQIDAFTYRFVGEEDVGGRHCRLVESVPKNPADEIYGKTILAIDPKDLLILKTQLFDQSGKLQKVWTVEKIEKVDGYWTPLVQTMVDLQDKHTSRLELTEVTYNAQVADEIFSRSYLTR